MVRVLREIGDDPGLVDLGTNVTEMMEILVTMKPDSLLKK